MLSFTYMLLPFTYTQQLATLHRGARRFSPVAEGALLVGEDRPLVRVFFCACLFIEYPVHTIEVDRPLVCVFVTVCS